MIMAVCKYCENSGVIYEGEIPKKCVCITVKEILIYLGVYKKALFFEDKNKLQRLDKLKFLLFNHSHYNISIEVFKQYVKSFLVHNIQKGERLSYETITASELVDTTIHSIEEKRDLGDKDIVFLILINDTPNSKYDEFISSYISKRLFSEKRLWVYTLNLPDSTVFQNRYGMEVSKLLLQHFSIVKNSKSVSKPIKIEEVESLKEKVSIVVEEDINEIL